MRKALLVIFCASTSFLHAQTGPGGVDSTEVASNLELWLRADNITGVSNGADLSNSNVWPDASGNSRDASIDGSVMLSGVLNFPSYNSSDADFNNQPSVSFDISNDEGLINPYGYEARTVFIVFNGVDDDTQFGQLWGDYDIAQVAIDARSGNELGFSFDGADNATAIYGLNGAAYTVSAEENTNTQPWAGGVTSIITAEFSANETLVNQVLGSLETNRGDFNLDGKIAEIVVYDRQLNDAERIAVENYLASKYSITVANDFFSLEATYGNDLGGLGSADGTNINQGANSGNLLRISDPQSAGAGEYLFFGHDNQATGVWSTTEIPTSVSSIQRISREWRLEETGDVGQVTFTINTDELATLPGGFSKYVLLVDDNGDFSDALVYELAGASNILDVSLDLDVSTTPYLSVGVIIPEVQFSSSAVSGTENTVVNLSVEVNYLSTSNIDFEYDTNDGTASAPTNYTAVVDGVGTITAGTQTTTIPVTLLEVASDLSFSATLSNPTPADALIGSQNSVTVLINDDDLTNEASFVTISASGSESVAEVPISVSLSEVDNLNDVDILYTVTGGTATNGTDYTAIGINTVTVPSGATQAVFFLDILDDAFEEASETIIIDILGATNANIASSNTQFTYTITNDDNVPEVQLATTSANGNESVSPISITVELSASSLSDITVDYVVSGTSTVGSDHSLNSGSIVISSGSISSVISLPIIDDSDSEVSETVIIELQTSANFNLGANTVFTYTIIDNDPFGSTGPGGVGDATINELWLKADEITGVADGVELSDSNLWPDASGNNRDASIDGGITLAGSLDYPAYTATNAAFNNKPTVTFTEADNDGLINSYSYDGRTVFAVFNIADGNFGQFWGNYDEAIHLTADTRPATNGFSFDANFVTTSQAIYGINGANFTTTPENNDDTQTYSAATTTLVTAQWTDNIGITNQVIGSLEPNRDDFNFDGDLAEVIVYSTTLDDTRRNIIENYLSSKYGITLSDGDDFYALEGTGHDNDVAGIGQESSIDFHLESQSSGILTVGNPSDLDDTEYLFFGHDGGDIAAWATANRPDGSYQTSSRVWRFDETGSVGTVDLTFSTTNLPSLPTGFTDYYLFVDNDADLSNGVTSQILLTESGTDRIASGITIADGSYVSVGIRNDFLVNFSATTASVGEESGTPTVAITLSQDPAAIVVVDIAVDLLSTATGGTAPLVSPEDFELTTTQVTFTNGGSLTQNVTLTINDDTDVEIEETVVLNLSVNSGAAAIGDSGTATVTINDNDNEGVVGPGGVGDAANNVFWIAADSITSAATEPTDTDAVTGWIDLSGNGNNLTASGDNPTYVGNGTNGKPAVNFDGNDGFTATDIISGNTGRTIFALLNPNTADGTATSNYMALNSGSGGSGGQDFDLSTEIEVRLNGGAPNWNTPANTGVYNLITTSLATGDVANEIDTYLDGALLTIAGSFAGSETQSISTGTDGTFVGGVGTTNGTFIGDIAEIIVYNQELNDAQRIIVENYLAAKYGLTITNDLYAYAPTHPNNLAGIGQQTSSEFHSAAQSDGLITVSNASSLDDGDYLLFGHDGTDRGSWVTTEVLGSNFERIAREWRVDQTGDVGTVKVTIDVNELPSLNPGFTNYALLVDSDGDFTGSATVIPLSLESGSNYVAENVSMADGNFLSIGAYTPVIAFENTTLNATESVGNTNVNINLNYPVGTDAVIDYTVTDGTAINPDDHALSSGQVTISAGETSVSLAIPIVDDDPAIIESDETFTITLDATSVGSIDGANNVLTVTINDDDNPIEIDFTVSSSSGSESNSPANITLRLNTTNGTDVSVDYAVSGGTAEGMGVDYTLDAGTATITAGNQTTTFPITISEDLIGEADETIEISLSNPIIDPSGSPVGGTLGTNTVHTFTIVDDDTSLDAGFTFASTGADEGAGTVTIEVSLSDVSASATTIDYSINIGSSATLNTDYTLPATQLVIPSGSQTGDISLTLTDDSDIEGGETIILDITGVDGANVGTNSSVTFTIADNDVSSDGDSGPAGVGSAANNVFWIAADSITSAAMEPVNNDVVATWIDLSGNGNDLTSSGGGDPTIFTNELNGLPVVDFDGDDGFTANPIITGTVGRTIFTIINPTTVTGAATSSFLSLNSGSAGSAGEDYDISTNISVAINSGRPDFPDANAGVFQVLTVSNPQGGQAQDIEVFVDGTSLTAGSIAGSATQSINTVSTATFIGGQGATTGTFDGEIAEIIAFNIELNDAQRIIVENYLVNKYALTYTDDFYAFQNTHPSDLVGIGRIDVDNQHFQAQSAGILTLGNPTAMGDNDFLLFAHDDGAIDAWVSTDVPDDDANILRISREWLIDSDQSTGDGDLGTLSVTIATASLPGFTSGYDNLALLVDGDGLFSSGSTIVPLTDNSDGTYSASGVSIPDNSYVTLAILRQEIQFELTSSQIGEENGPASIVVSTNRASSEDITVTYELTGGTAQMDDYTVTTPGTLTISAGNTSASISVGITNDSDAESSETLIFTLSSPSGAVLGTNIAHTLSIDDDDQSRRVEFSSISATNDESVNNASFTVQLNFVDNTNPSTVDYAVTGGTATGSGIDYTLSAGTATIAATQSSATIDFTINQDVSLEADETIIVTLSNPDNAALGDNDTFTYTITNDDTGPNVNFSTLTPSSSESVTPAQIEVSLSDFSGLDATVDYALTVGGTATSGVDFTLTSGTLTIPAGSLTGNILPIIIDDSEIEAAETFLILLSNASGATLPVSAGDRTATFTITDNDNSGISGPAGVGDENNNPLWLKADSVNTGTEPIDNSAITVWVDASGNSNGLTAAGDPTYIQSAINGNPAIRFDGTSDGLFGPDVMEGNVGRTIFAVLNPTTADGNSTSNYLSLNSGSAGSGGQDFDLSTEIEVRLNGGAPNWNTPANAGVYNLITTSVMAGGVANEMETYLDGTELTIAGSFAGSETQAINTGTSGTYLGGVGPATGTFIGDIAEVIVYDQELNTAQRVVVENYLAEKYALTIANDFYDNSTYSNDLAGIGQSGGEQHLAAQSARVLSLSNPASLDADGEFIFFGHDNASVGSWSISEAPNSGENIQRLGREWIVEVTGTPGAVTVGIDPTDLPSVPGGYDSYFVLVDSDGDFSSGASFFSTTLSADNIYEANNISLSTGNYIAIAVVRPVIEFTTETSSEFEPDGPASIGVSLNFPLSESVDVGYAVTGGTATGGGTDYTLNSGTASVTAGNTSTSFQIFLTNDTDGTESDETVEITLSGVSTANASIGTQDVHTFTIQDDDNLRKIFFPAETVTVAEAVGTSDVIVNITAAELDLVNDTQVDISVGAASTATLGTDFTLSATTVTIPAGETDTNTAGTNLVVTINNDGTSEEDETIVLEMANPVNGNLASGADPSPNFTTYTFTITDDDSDPTVEFSSSAVTVGEDAGTAQVELALSAESGRDVTVAYTISGTADAGVDYTFAAGSTTISAGTTTTNLDIVLIDDATIEAPETLIIDLTDPPTNATLGANQQITVTISDNDNDGITGPGGVGDASNNIFWVQADSVTSAVGEPSDTDILTTWIDLSGNGNDLTATGNPSYIASAVNSQPAIDFDGTDDGFSAVDIISGTVGRTIFTVLNPTTNGSYFSLNSGSTGGAGEDYDVSSAISVAISSGRPDFSAANTGVYNIIRVSNPTAGQAQDIQVFLDGSELTPSGIAGSSTQDITTQTSGTFLGGTGAGGVGTFNGEIAETIVYNVDLNLAQKIIVDNYLSAKYNVSIGAIDRYSSAVNIHDVAGIGRTSNVEHTAAQSASLVTIEGASSLENDDFLLFGHDDLSIGAWTTTESPDVTNIQRIAREWFIDETGEVGTVTVKLADATLLPAQPTDFEIYVLLVDADGNFSDATVYTMTNTTGNEYEVIGLDLADNSYITFGVIRNVTDGSNGDFSDTGTWTSNIVPGSGQPANITDNDDVFLSEDVTIGQLIINDGASLDLAGYNLTIDTDSIQLIGTGALILNNGTVTYSAAGAQNISGRNYYNLVINGTGTKTLLGPTDVDGNLTINSTLDVSAANDYSINLAGNLDNNGTFNAQEGTVVFDGTTDQTVDGILTFYNLQLNKATGNMIMNTSVGISNNLDLTNGDIVLGNFDLSIAASGTITNASATSYIQADGVGTVIKQIDAVMVDYFNYEVGDVAIYSPFYLRLNAGTIGASASINVNVDNAVNANLRTDLSHLSRYWTFEDSDLTGSIDYDIAFIYDEADDVAGIESQLVPIKFLTDVDTSGYTQGVDYDIDVAANRIFWNGLTTFSEGSAGVDEDDPVFLPIELLFVKASLVEDDVVIEWATATEINNDFFTIEKSYDWETFVEVGIVDGAGDSDDRIDYQLIDRNPYPGVSYYRLKQTDFDGTFTYSNLVRVETDFSTDGDVELDIYPIPSELSEGMTLSMNDMVPGTQVTIKVVALDGRESYTANAFANQNGEINRTIILPSYAAKGQYIVYLEYDGVLNFVRTTIK